MTLGAGLVVGPSRSLVGPCWSLAGPGLLRQLFAPPCPQCQGVSRLSHSSQPTQWSSTSPTNARSPRPGLGPQNPSARSLALSAPRHFQPKLAPSEVTSVLRNNEYTCSDLPAGPVKFFDTNTLQSNDPIEDSYASALTVGGGYLFGIFDGHGGAACGQVVAKRLLHYIAAGLLSPTDLAKHRDVWLDGKKESLVRVFNDNFELVQDLKQLYQRSYVEYLTELQGWTAGSKEVHDIEDILVHAFTRLDEDMSREAIPKDGQEVDMKTLTVAMSGCVAVAAHIEGPHLSVASTGDCTAVVGSLSETDTWVAKKLTNEHNSDNNREVKRILANHPETEHHHIIKGDRLLGMLAPLRAFGDFKFKWPRSTIEETLGGVLGEHAVPANYKTPPYLTAVPEVTYHRLTPRDKFLILGSDGLWDMMTPMQVVRLVGEHMSGKVCLSPLHLTQPNIPLEEIAMVLKKRQESMRLKPNDGNAATHLIRSALGGTAYGVDHGRLSQMLTIPQDMVRMFRDDITITVIFFEDEYLRFC